MEHPELIKLAGRWSFTTYCTQCGGPIVSKGTPEVDTSDYRDSQGRCYHCHQKAKKKGKS